MVCICIWRSRDKEGKSFGGHLKEGTIIHPTAELVIGEDEQAVILASWMKKPASLELKVTAK